MGKFATRFDAGRVSAHDATRVVEDAAAIERMAATVKSLAAARVAETNLWKRDGDLSAAHHLARTTGTPVGQAREALESARRLQGLSAIEAAARRGELSAHQVAVITDAASADPSAETRLLKQAQSGSYGELRDECARTKANVTDLEERRRRIHRQRYLRTWADTDGAALLQMRDNPEVVAGIMGSLEPIRDELSENARNDGRREREDAHARTPSPSLPAASTATAPMRGGRGGRDSSFESTSPGCLACPRGMTKCASSRATGPSPPRRSATSSTPKTRSSPRSSPKARTWSASPTSDDAPTPTSKLPSSGSTRPAPPRAATAPLAFLENDHRRDWSKTHMTIFEWLDRLCGHHHDLKTAENWALVDGRGKRALVPPDDPRHPRNAHAPPAAA